MRIGAVAAVLFLVGVVRAQEPSPEEKKKLEAEARAKITQFKKEFREAGKNQMAASTAIMRLGEMQHKIILTELKRYLIGSSTVLVNAAANEVGKYKGDKGAAEMLLAAATKNRDSASKILCFRALGNIEYRPIAKRLVPYLQSKDIAVAGEVVGVLGRLKSKLGITPLLTAAKKFENSSDKAQTDLLPNVYASLEMITGQKFATLKEWDMWWRKNKFRFKELD